MRHPSRGCAPAGEASGPLGVDNLRPRRARQEPRHAPPGRGPLGVDNLRPQQAALAGAPPAASARPRAKICRMRAAPAAGQGAAGRRRQGRAGLSRGYGSICECESTSRPAAGDQACRRPPGVPVHAAMLGLRDVVRGSPRHPWSPEENAPVHPPPGRRSRGSRSRGTQAESLITSSAGAVPCSLRRLGTRPCRPGSGAGTPPPTAGPSFARCSCR